MKIIEDTVNIAVQESFFQSLNCKKYHLKGIRVETWGFFNHYFLNSLYNNSMLPDYTHPFIHVVNMLIIFQ